MLELTSIVLRVFEFFIEFKLACNLIQKKLSNLKIFFITVICALSFEFIIKILPQYTQSFLCATLAITLFKILTKENWSKIILLWLKILVLVAIIDTIITFSFIKIFNISNIEEITTNAQYGIVGRILLIVILYLVYLVFNLNIKNTIVNINKKAFIGNTITTFILLMPNLMMLIYYYFSRELPLMLVIINISAIILMFVFSNINTMRNFKLIQAEEELLTEKTYNKTLEDLVDGLRTFKHDYNNTLQTIYGYILTNDMPELKNFFNQILNESREITALDKLKPELFKNPSLFGLVTAKFEYARKSEVTMNLEIYGELDNLEIKTYDFTRMFGIFLDNAIEAAAGSEKKVVNLYVVERNAKVTIEISNSFSDTGLKVEDISKKGVSSKGDNRGLGLYKVKEILKKYPRIKHDTNSSNDMFLQRLVIDKVKEVSLK